MSDDGEFYDSIEFYDKVFKAKADNPEMFVSNWEEDNANINSWTEAEIKADPHKQLITEAETGNLKAIKSLLINAEIDINAEDNDGYRALHRACYNGHVETAKYLIEKGVKVNAQTKLGWTALHSSVYWNQLECIELLLDSGININIVTEGGQTALHLACSKYDIYPEILALLLSNCDVDLDLKNAQGDTCMEIAARHTPYAYFFYPFKRCCFQLRE